VREEGETEGRRRGGGGSNAGIQGDRREREGRRAGARQGNGRLCALR
jgi:hypothetical protein